LEKTHRPPPTGQAEYRYFPEVLDTRRHRHHPKPQSNKAHCASFEYHLGIWNVGYRDQGLAARHAAGAIE
jgi:hypothetical protein